MMSLPQKQKHIGVAGTGWARTKTQGAYAQRGGPGALHFGPSAPGAAAPLPRASLPSHLSLRPALSFQRALSSTSSPLFHSIFLFFHRRALVLEHLLPFRTPPFHSKSPFHSKLHPVVLTLHGTCPLFRLCALLFSAPALSI